MVKNIIRLLNRQFGNINEAALLLGVFSLVSQLLGLFRDRSLAHILGASQSLDIYYAAFRLPDFLYASVGSLAAITVLLPFLVEKMSHSEDGVERARKFMSEVISVLFMTLFVISIILFIAMPLVAHYLAPGFTASEITRLVSISRIMLLSPIIFGVSNTLGSVTQVYRKFFVYALSPVFYNLGIVIGIFAFYPLFGLRGLGFGIILGCCMHLAIQIPVLWRHRFIPRLTFNVNLKEIRSVVTLSLPRTLGLACTNISMLLLVALMSKLGQGAISIFTLSYNLQTTPAMIVGISYSVASFPLLVTLFTNKDRQEFFRHIFIATRNIIFWSLPIMFLFIVLRAQIVRVAYGSGAFSWNDTRLTAAALAIFSISVLAQSLIYLFVRAFYAAGNTKTPLVINFLSVFLTVGSAFLFIHLYHHHALFQAFTENLFRVQGIPGTDVLMVPLAYSIGAIINCIFLWIFFLFKFKPRKLEGVGKTLLQSTLASFALAFTAYGLLQPLAHIFNQNRFVGIFLQGLFAGLGGILVAMLVLFILKSRELNDFFKAVREKFWKTRPLLVEKEQL